MGLPKRAWQCWWNIIGKSIFGKRFEGEIIIRTLPTTFQLKLGKTYLKFLSYFKYYRSRWEFLKELHIMSKLGRTTLHAEYFFLGHFNLCSFQRTIIRKEVQLSLEIWTPFRSWTPLYLEQFPKTHTKIDVPTIQVQIRSFRDWALVEPLKWHTGTDFSMIYLCLLFL